MKIDTVFGKDRMLSDGEIMVVLRDAQITVFASPDGSTAHLFINLDEADRLAFQLNSALQELDKKNNAHEQLEHCSRSTECV